MDFKDFSIGCFGILAILLAVVIILCIVMFVAKVVSIIFLGLLIISPFVLFFIWLYDKFKG